MQITWSTAFKRCPRLFFHVKFALEVKTYESLLCFFSGFFRRFRRLTRRNSEFDEDFGWVRQKLFEVGQKSGELDLDFYLKILSHWNSLTENQAYCIKQWSFISWKTWNTSFYYFSQNNCSKWTKFWVGQKILLS